MNHFSRREFLQQAAPLGAVTLTAGVFAIRLCSSPGRNRRHRVWDGDLSMGTGLGPSDPDPQLHDGPRARRGAPHDARPSRRAQLVGRPTQGGREKRFQDSPVQLVGLGSAEEFHSPDPGKVQRAIENTKAFIRLSHNVGGSGVKVRPNDLPGAYRPRKRSSRSARP